MRGEEEETTIGDRPIGDEKTDRFLCYVFFIFVLWQIQIQKHENRSQLSRAASCMNAILNFGKSQFIIRKESGWWSEQQSSKLVLRKTAICRRSVQRWWYLSWIDNVNAPALTLRNDKKTTKDKGAGRPQKVNFVCFELSVLILPGLNLSDLIWSVLILICSHFDLISFCLFPIREAYDKSWVMNQIKRNSGQKRTQLSESAQSRPLFCFCYALLLILPLL